MNAAPGTVPACAEPPATAPTGHFRVLVVDDEPNVLSALQRLLRSRGYQVDTAEGGAAALAQLAQLQPHGIITDLRMPGMNGAEFLKASRAHSPNAVRLLLTGHADITSALQAVNEGEVFRYLTKPWDDTLLIAALEEGLERHRLRAERDQLLDLTARQNAELQELNHHLEGLVQARTDELQQALGRNEQVHQQLKRGFVATMQMFSSLVEARAGLTRGCARRVADHVRRMAPLLGMTAEEQQDTLFAAMLIDLGKVLLPERLTLRPYAELQGEDRNLWLAHPLHAHSLMMGVETLRGAAYVLRSLNERCDGTGVPDRLPAALIGVGTRLLMVAVDYESMLAGAQVRARLNPAQATQMLRSAAGQRLDAQIVALFVESLQAPPPVVRTRRTVTAAELCVGMHLAEDLLSKDGVVLLARGHVIDTALIQHFRSHEIRNDLSLKLVVLDAMPTC